MTETILGYPITPETTPRIVGALAYQWGLSSDCLDEQARQEWMRAAENDPHYHDVAERNAGRSLMTLQEALGLSEEEVLELCSNGLQLAGYLEERDELHARITEEPGYEESLPSFH